MKASIQFEPQGTATLIEMVGDNATLQSDFSAPPGATLRGSSANGEQTVLIKVRDCRRCPTAPNQFVLRGRWVNLSRDAREALAGSLTDSQAK